MPLEPTNELPKAYDPALIEQKWATFWVDEKIFNVATPPPPEDFSSRPEAQSAAVERPASRTTTGAPFVQLLPPPNVTGRLHIGHMLEHTQMDILARWHRMLGDTSVWVPGTDHAGIATQMMVERQLKTERKSRTDFTREAFTEKVWAWKREYGSAITDQMRRLGASVDWSREYFTMDDRLSVAVKEAFVRLYEQGLIYRGAYIVNWDPTLQTAVSDLEVDSRRAPRQASTTSAIDLADGSGSIVIATTRPETMLGRRAAVAVNPDDERYQHLIGKMLVLPLVDREIPIIADDWAQPRVRHRRRQGHARARPQRLRHRPAPQPAPAQHHGRLSAHIRARRLALSMAWTASRLASASSPTSKPPATSSPSKTTPSRLAHLAAHRRHHRAAPLHAVVPRCQQNPLIVIGGGRGLQPPENKRLRTGL